MSASGRFLSNVGAIVKAADDGRRKGMVAAGYVVRNAVVRRLMHGYTTGAFSHGGAGVAGRVTVGPVTVTPTGYQVRVGTNVLYALFWELGHQNLFTRKFERVEVWGPAMLETREQQKAAYTAQVTRAMRAAAGRLAP